MGSNPKKFRLVAEACQVARSVSLYVGAIAVLSVLMAFVGWHTAAVLLGAVAMMIALLLVLQVRHAVGLLHTRHQNANESAARAERHYVEMLWRMVKLLEARDKTTDGHSQRVAELSEQIAHQMDLPEHICRRMNLAGQLHDVGMLAVSEKILSQSNRLEGDQYATVKNHTEAGYEVLKPLKSLADILPAVKYHHERMNGTGYPEGIAGEDIPIEARIVAVADAYDAMTHDRPYRSAMAPIMAMEELERCSPHGYDSHCVRALTELKSLTHLKEAMACV